MSRNLLSALIVALIGAIWLGYHQFGKLNDQIFELATRVAEIEGPSADALKESEDGETILERVQKLEWEITALKKQTVATGSQQTVAPDALEPVKETRPQIKPIHVRKFTNRANLKTIDALLVAVKGPNVTIRRIDGKQFTFPIARLSHEDQIYIAEHADSIPPASSPVINPDASANGGTFGGNFDFNTLFDDAN